MSWLKGKKFFSFSPTLIFQEQAAKRCQSRKPKGCGGSNKPFEEWGEIFCDDIIASAILDRLLHHSHIIAINGPSYKTKEKMGATSNN
ncbi:MAG TPA: hypothetical protein ENI35_00285 [Candidatus Desulfofervidus auxilii]|uniref:IstB-like ATP-binding domain-containing protein n=1 Tax=Desulfofervidus auxilii TaxID=1621989 RepID=A0A7C1ZDV7_DESA2|nr:hypothetical protein [Candidatus Desulfofervidus auxilii]